ncbi:N-acetylglucosamine kinase [Algicola sagamiensis]|uniref:N-acetylglucosamine kinase n=1 Tax=Algicola sagamiensis TaxID=163869 RepID=UPI000375CC0B|nr:BadF/BadG/BcrA/BcrD ATPase family protein [Algicola sagamiensis]
MTEANTTTSETLFLGVDGGGTKCKAKLVSASGEVLGVGISGPANPMVDPVEAKQSILESAQRALSDASLPSSQSHRVVAGVGLAGVNIHSCYQQVSQWQHPFQAFYLTTDLDIACLGAHQGQDGAVVVVGTGSCALAKQGTTNLYIGGQGFLLGDKGSGAWFGLEAVKHCLLTIDGIMPPSILSEQILRELDCEDAQTIVSLLARASSSQFAKLAPSVFDCAIQGDEIATKMVREGASYISDLIRRVLVLSPERISILGGLSHLLLPWLEYDVAKQLTEPRLSPEDGAILFAQQQMDHFSMQSVENRGNAYVWHNHGTGSERSASKAG